MKKTLLVTIDYPPHIGGVATYLSQVAHSMEDDKLLVLTLPEKDASLDKRVIRRPLLFRFVWPKWLRGVWEVYRVYKAHDCEQIYVGQVLPIGTMAYVLHRLFGVPYIVQIYGMDLLQAKKHRRKLVLAKRVLKNAKLVIANSVQVQHLVADIAGLDVRTKVVYPIPDIQNNVDAKQVEHLRKQYQLEGKKIVLTVSRLVPRKGIDTTLGALAKLWQTHRDVVYVIIGDGPDRERITALAEPHKDKVIFTGFVSDANRNAWFEIADVFCMPARALPDDIEGFGTVYLEANAHALPVIAGNVGGPVEAVHDGETGLLVDPNSVDEVVRALETLITDTAFANKLAQQGKERVINSFTWKNEVAKLRAYLR